MKKICTFLAINVFMLFLISVEAQIPNNGFEDWVLEGNDYNPVFWSTTNADPYVSVEPYTPAYEGNFSVKVSAFFAEVFNVSGVASIEFPYSQRPVELSACIKTTVMPGDHVYLIVSLFQGDSIVASPTNCSFSIDTTYSDFTCFTFPITYISELIPDSASIMIVAGGAFAAQLGTEIIVDEMYFNLTTAVDETIIAANSNTGNFPNPAANFTYIPVNLLNESDVEVLIWDTRGNLVQSNPFPYLKVGTHKLLVNTSQLINGIYPYSVKGENFTFFGKMVICK